VGCLAVVQFAIEDGSFSKAFSSVCGSCWSRIMRARWSRSTSSGAKYASVSTGGAESKDK
jgi:hypothetical protein